MAEPLYAGSVKDVYGPYSVAFEGSPAPVSALVFHYTDAYSVFDWGKMPDAIKGKGQALAVMAAHFFDRLGQPESWKQFSKSPEALRLRKANRFGAGFNEVGESLQRTGLKHHALGLLENSPGENAAPTSFEILKTDAEFRKTPRALMVRSVDVLRPKLSTILGQSVPDYESAPTAGRDRLLPLEVVFRWSCPAGSSLHGRLQAEPSYLASRGFGEWRLGDVWDFPTLELFTKLESTDRALGLTEALAISRVPAEVLERTLFLTAWVAAFLKWQWASHGFELADGKLEWAITPGGELCLIDAIGPDELRVLKDGVQLSKELMRLFYRKTPWYAAVEAAKVESGSGPDWKKHVKIPAPSLPPQWLETVEQLYAVMANEITGRKWFPQAWSLDQLVVEVKSLRGPA